MKALKNYRAFQARKELQMKSIRINEINKIKFSFEKLDKIEKEMYHSALRELKVNNDEAVLKQPKNVRRYKIFQAFKAGDYLNEITRMSIIKSLINVNK